MSNAYRTSHTHVMCDTVAMRPVQHSVTHAHAHTRPYEKDRESIRSSDSKLDVKNRTQSDTIPSVQHHYLVSHKAAGLPSQQSMLGAI
mmetsp:Transcript_15353/g.36492  ORF Transcript_15353/g.36492 Transcript_15353/m.36492 type:complete len:88 (-) Transcript_15353:617-880(-)